MCFLLCCFVFCCAFSPSFFGGRDGGGGASVGRVRMYAVNKINGKVWYTFVRERERERERGHRCCRPFSLSLSHFPQGSAEADTESSRWEERRCHTCPEQGSHRLPAYFCVSVCDRRVPSSPFVLVDDVKELLFCIGIVLSCFAWGVFFFVFCRLLVRCVCFPWVLSSFFLLCASPSVVFVCCCVRIQQAVCSHRQHGMQQRYGYARSIGLFLLRNMREWGGGSGEEGRWGEGEGWRWCEAKVLSIVPRTRRCTQLSLGKGGRERMGGWTSPLSVSSSKRCSWVAEQGKE